MDHLGSAVFLTNDVRFFVHKRLLGAARGFVESGFNPISALGGFVTAGGDKKRQAAAARKFGLTVVQPGSRFAQPLSRAAVRRPSSRTTTARPSASGAAQKNAGRAVKFGGGDTGPGGSCPGVFWVNTDVGCVNVVTGETSRRSLANGGGGGGGGGAVTPIGDTVMGRYGAGEVPGSMMIDRAVCRPGMVLGNDGICYNRSQITNKEREWPRGRRPLLTGGDMRAISTAARAGKRLEGATKRLQKIGLMKKPAPRRKITAAEIHHAK